MKVPRLTALAGLAVLALGVSPGALAQTGDAFKGVYFGGQMFIFQSTVTLSPPSTDLSVQAMVWDANGAHRRWTLDWGSHPRRGGMGAVVFNATPYCFFTTTDGQLQYVTVDPGGATKSGPTTIATGVGAAGAAAAVAGDTLYVFTGSRAFTSKDGKQFANWPLASALPASTVLDAVTFYRATGSPAGIMVVYNDTSSPVKLSARAVYPPANDWSGTALPFPSTGSCAWLPVFSGNLVIGTVSPGIRAPALQFYGLTGVSGCNLQSEGRWEYDIGKDSWTFSQLGNNKVLVGIAVVPWLDTVDSVKGTMRLSHSLLEAASFYNYSLLRSDWLVPQHDDPNYGWAGTPTVTSTATGNSDADKMLRSLWTLTGMILGPPPFALNGIPDAAYPKVLSAVDYGVDQSTSVATKTTAKRTVSLAIKNSIKAGFGQLNFDLSYAHGWTSSRGTTSTVEVSSNYSFGPMDETPPDQGIHGWALFGAPTLLTQQFKVYAYDYDPATAGSGTYLDEDVYATSVGAVVPQTAYFDLENPAVGSIPGLFAGLPAYPASTDVTRWLHIRDWNHGGADWTAIFGDLSSPAVGTLTVGTEVTQTYTQSTSTLRSSGNSNSFSLDAGAKFDFFGGFTTGTTVGYETEFETETDTESTITRSVSSSLRMPIPPAHPGYVTSMTVQPYWLAAKTVSAPWIPGPYAGNLPWCITWNVLDYNVASGARAGTAPPPESAVGELRGGHGKEDTYTLRSGRLAFLVSGTGETPLSLGADDFRPSRGATVFLNDHAFVADQRNGTWVRTRNSWSYRSRHGARRDSLSLELDFARKTWSMAASSPDLDREIGTSGRPVRVRLSLQGTHVLTTWLRHDSEESWSHREPKATWEPRGVHGVEGSWDSRTASGWISLDGHIPTHDTRFGDLEIRVNGARVRVPLLAGTGFLEALDGGREIAYRAEGLEFDLDPGTGRWTALVEKGLFEAAMAPRDGTVRVELLLGGERVSDQALVVRSHHSRITFGN